MHTYIVCSMNCVVLTVLCTYIYTLIVTICIITYACTCKYRGRLVGASLSEPHHMRSTLKSIFLLACLLDTSSLIWFKDT